MAEYNHEIYYWMKLKGGFFKRHDIRIIEAMPNGEKYVLYYMKLMAESVDHCGELRFSKDIPYTEEMLHVITNTDIDIVRSANKILEQLGMIEWTEDKTLVLPEVKPLIGYQSVGAEKKQIQRQKQQQLLQGGQEVDKCPPEIDIDIESMINILKEKMINTPVYIGANVPKIDEIINALVAATKYDTIHFAGKTYTGESFKRVVKFFTIEQAVAVANRMNGANINDRERYIQSIIAQKYALAEGESE